MSVAVGNGGNGLADGPSVIGTGVDAEAGVASNITTGVIVGGVDRGADHV